MAFDVEVGSLLHRRLVHRAARLFTELFGEIVPIRSLVFELTTLDPAELVSDDLRIDVNQRATVVIDLSLVPGDYDWDLAHEFGMDCGRDACSPCWSNHRTPTQGVEVVAS